MDVHSNRRVKLYVLDKDRAWADQGTGYISTMYVEKLKKMSLCVRSETNGSIILESKIQQETTYQKQQDTLIVWSEFDNDFALSFQEKAGCDEVWAKICEVQGRDPSLQLSHECGLAGEEGADSVEMSMDDERFQGTLEAEPPIELPPCELSKLDEISELFSSILGAPAQQERLAAAIDREGYIKKLLDLFHMCEDLENMEGLHHLYDIFKSIFSLNKTELFEVMFQDDNIFDVVGVLEYDHRAPQPNKHRDFLWSRAKFKEVVPVNNQELVQKIHQTYRIQYIHDVLLPAPSVFEDNMLSTLTSIILFNKSEIVSILQEDENFLQCLFQQIADEDVEDERRKDLILFLKEFCMFSQTLQQDSKAIFLKNLMDFGVLGAIEVVLGLDDEEIKSAALDVFSFILEHNPSSVRTFILQESHHQEDDDLLVNLVIEQLISDTDPELAGSMKLMGTMRILLDPESMTLSENKTEKTEFLSFFYKHSMHVLTAPLFANTAGESPSKDDYRTAQLLSLIMELLTFCIEHHTFHMKNYIVNKDLVRRALVLLKSKHAFLALAALRLVRKLIGLKDEFYSKYLINGDLFKPIAEAFQANGNRYNLLNSAFIELFEFIKTESMEGLVKYTVERHYKAFDGVDYVKTFKTLKDRYDEYSSSTQDKQAMDSTPPILRANSRFRREARTMEEEEEIWFEGDEDFAEEENMLPMTDMLKPKADTVFDQLHRFFDRTSFTNTLIDTKGNDYKDAPPRLLNRTTSPISINLIRSTSPPLSPTPTPQTSPAGSPQSPVTHLKQNINKASALQIQNNAKPGLVGLVDYPDDDEEEEDTEDGESPAVKRARIGT